MRRLLRLTLLLLAFVAFLSISFPVSSLSQKLEDLYFRLRPSEAPSPDVALVLIDDAALEHYGRWPWPRRRLAQLVRAVNDSHPRAIGVDILLSEVEDESNDSELEKALRASRNLVLAAKISNSADGSLWVEPLPRFARGSSRWTLAQDREPGKTHWLILSSRTPPDRQLRTTLNFGFGFNGR